MSFYYSSSFLVLTSKLLNFFSKLGNLLVILLLNVCFEATIESFKRSWRQINCLLKQLLRLSLLNCLNVIFFSCIRDLILLLNYGASLSSHNTVLCGIKFVSIFRIVSLKIFTFSLMFLFRNALCQLN